MYWIQYWTKKATAEIYRRYFEEMAFLKFYSLLLYGMTSSKSMDQPDSKVDNPARDQLNRENEYFPVHVRA